MGNNFLSSHDVNVWSSGIINYVMITLRSQRVKSLNCFFVWFLVHFWKYRGGFNSVMKAKQYVRENKVGKFNFFTFDCPYFLVWWRLWKKLKFFRNTLEILSTMYLTVKVRKQFLSQHLLLSYHHANAVGGDQEVLVQEVLWKILFILKQFEAHNFWYLFTNINVNTILNFCFSHH